MCLQIPRTKIAAATVLITGLVAFQTGPAWTQSDDVLAAAHRDCAALQEAYFDKLKEIAAIDDAYKAAADKIFDEYANDLDRYEAELGQANAAVAREEKLGNAKHAAEMRKWASSMQTMIDGVRGRMNAQLNDLHTQLLQRHLTLQMAGQTWQDCFDKQVAARSEKPTPEDQLIDILLEAGKRTISSEELERLRQLGEEHQAGETGVRISKERVERTRTHIQSAEEKAKTPYGHDPNASAIGGAILYGVITGAIRRGGGGGPSSGGPSGPASPGCPGGGCRR